MPVAQWAEEVNSVSLSPDLCSSFALLPFRVCIFLKKKKGWDNDKIQPWQKVSCGQLSSSGLLQPSLWCWWWDAWVGLRKTYFISAFNRTVVLIFPWRDAEPAEDFFKRSYCPPLGVECQGCCWPNKDGTSRGLNCYMKKRQRPSKVAAHSHPHIQHSLVQWVEKGLIYLGFPN